MNYWEHIEHAFEKTSIYDGGVVFGEGFAQLPIYVGDLLAAHWTLSEVSNGGLHQFFYNAGVLAPEAAQGFERMGLPEVAELIWQAMAHFGDTYPREERDRMPFLDSCDLEVFEPLEQRLYEIGSPNLGRIYDVMDEYATQNNASG